LEGTGTLDAMLDEAEEKAGAASKILSVATAVATAVLDVAREIPFIGLVTTPILKGIRCGL
jgi:hypothetical protein